MTDKILAWHFAKDDNKLNYGDGREIVIGETHSVEGTPSLCEWGLHGSTRIRDALRYAPGSMVYRVEIWGNVDSGDDKICGTHRRYLWGFNASDVLYEASRRFALANIEKIKPFTDQKQYDLIIKWLHTGEEEIRSAAQSAADSAARSSSWSALWSAARSAARSAAQSAAQSAADSAARGAADSAADSAVWSAADSAARSAARSSSWSAQNDLLALMVYEEAERLGLIDGEW